MARQIMNPFQTLTDIDGSPLEDGYIYIGQPSLDPVANPKNAYWDEALTILASQPIRTKGGYPYNGSFPGRLFVDGNYSILIRNKRNLDVYSFVTAPQDLQGQVDALDVRVTANEVDIAALNGRVTTLESSLITVSASGPITLSGQHHLINLDVSLGNISCSLPAGDFVGQKLTVYASGTNIADLSGTGLYTNNVFYTENTGRHTIEWNGSAWKHSPALTAHYSSSPWDIRKYGNGDIELFALNQNANNTGTIILTFPVTLADTGYHDSLTRIGGTTTTDVLTGSSTKTTTQYAAISSANVISYNAMFSNVKY